MLFGDVLELLSGVLLVEDELLPGCVEVEEPALPLMLPAVLLVDVEELELVEPIAPAPAVAAETWMSSFTFFTPVTDFASFFASLRSSLLFTEPVSFTVPLSTST